MDPVAVNGTEDARVIRRSMVVGALGFAVIPGEELGIKAHSSMIVYYNAKGREMRRAPATVVEQKMFDLLCTPDNEWPGAESG